MSTQKKVIAIALILAILFMFVTSIGSNSYAANGNSNKYELNKSQYVLPDGRKLPKGFVPISLLSNKAFLWNFALKQIPKGAKLVSVGATIVYSGKPVKRITINKN